jgi:hypothetical protein
MSGDPGPADVHNVPAWSRELKIVSIDALSEKAGGCERREACDKQAM